MHVEKRKVILVTGGAGYIGSHACKALSAAGYLPVCYDNLYSGSRTAVQWGPLEEGDLLDSRRLDAVIARYQPDSVMHFAARVSVPESVADPAVYYRTNVSGTLNLLEAMRRHGLLKLVFSSTCAIYGAPGSIPVVETDAKLPLNPYGSSKLMGETMLEQYSAAYGLRYVALRYFNVAGADPDGTTGECDAAVTRLIPLVLDTAAGIREYIEVFGEDYPTPDGTGIRDYIHVCDIADAHLLALRHLDHGAPSTAFNVGNSRGISVKEIIELSRRITGRHIAVKSGRRRAGDPPLLIADATRIRKELGWTPKLSDPKTIIETAWNWHRQLHGSD